MAKGGRNEDRGPRGTFVRTDGSNKRDDRKSAGNAAGDYVSPEQAAAAAGPGAEPGSARSSRRTESGGNTTAGARTGTGAKATASLDVSSAIGILQGFHAMIAMQRSEPHWMLNDKDATQYGTALAAAMRHFPVQATQKALDFAALAFCVFSFETPRIALSMQLAKQRQRAQQQQPAGATVYSVGGNGAGPDVTNRPGGKAPPQPMAEPPADDLEYMQ